MVALPSLLHAVAASSAASSFMSPFSVLHPVDCDVSHMADQVGIPHNQSQLVLPQLKPAFVGLAFGVQNYTCTQNNNYTSAGAVAQLIDTSCLAGSSGFTRLPDTLYDAWVNYDEGSIQDVIEEHLLTHPVGILAQHYFIPNPVTGQGLSPKWDFTQLERFKGNLDAFVVVKAKSSIPAPTGPQDIAWLNVVNIQGKIADEVFRTDTRGGQAPPSCKYGEDEGISVKYVSNYWFFGGSLGSSGDQYQ